MEALGIDAPPPPVKTPEPPYYSVIFCARLRDAPLSDYQDDSRFLMNKARKLEGFLGEDALRMEDRRLISVSYWRDLESIDRWRRDLDHIEAKKRGRSDFYEYFELRIARVEHANSFYYCAGE